MAHVSLLRSRTLLLLGGLTLAACGDQPTLTSPGKAPTVKAPAPVASVAATPVASDVTYGMLHGSFRVWNPAVVGVSAGTFSGSTAEVPPGAQVHVKGNWQVGPVTNTSYCPYCIIEEYIAWIPTAAANGATPFNIGVWLGGTSYVNPNPGPSGGFDWTTTAPTVPGTYYIGTGGSLDYSFRPWIQGGFGHVTGDTTQAASFRIVVLDQTPPVITGSLAGTLGNADWYTSDVAISWSVTDAESDITSAAGCDAATVTTDTPGTTRTCTATSQGGTASGSVSFKRDATPPVVAYAGNAGTYDVSALVAITCSATDALSGVASTTCAGISGDAWSFALGPNSFSASATDVAGNTGTGSTSFTVIASYSGVCSLVERFVSQGGVANSLCAKVRAAQAAANRGQRTGSLQAFINELSAQSGKLVPADKATLLATYARALMN